MRVYAKTHEWIVEESNELRVGISEHAQKTLGDIMFCDLPKVGVSVRKGDEIVIIESMKAVSPVHAPVDGTITAVNSALTKKPELLNRDPLSSGWLFTLSPSAPFNSSDFMEENDYKQYLLK